MIHLPLLVGQQEQKRRSADHEQQERQRIITERRDDRRDRAKYRAENVEFIHSCSNLGLDHNPDKTRMIHGQDSCTLGKQVVNNSRHYPASSVSCA